MTQAELLKNGKELLKQNRIDDADFKARKLLEFVLNESREQFILNSLNVVPKELQQRYEKYLSEIIKGRPIQYITNSQEFIGLQFYVNEKVLIPQPDTEILVLEAIKIINQSNVNKLNDLSKLQQDSSHQGKLQHNNSEKKLSNKEIQVLDLCTGSGAIAISIEKQLQNDLKIKMYASDISRDALKVAKKNALNNEVDITLIQSDLFENLDEYKFDVIVSNPPYIETDVIKTLNKEVQNEPMLALDGGEDGLDFYRKILEHTEKYLNDNGYLLFEIGYDQGEKIIELWRKLKDVGKCNLKLITKQPIKDLGENDRVMILKKAKASFEK